MATAVPPRSDASAVTSQSRSSGDALAIASELRIVWRQQLEPSEGTLAEVVDDAAVAEHAVHVPVRRHRPEVDDLDMPAQNSR